MKKFKKTKIVLLVLGLVFIALAPVWRFVIFPKLIMIPDTVDITFLFEGTLRINIDLKTFSIYPKGQEVQVPIEISLSLKSDASKGDKNIAVINETISVKSTTGLELGSEKHVLAIQRKDGKYVKGYGSDQKRKGYFIPVGLKPTIFEGWDDEISDAVKIQFVRQETRDGNDSNNITVYLFDITIDTKELTVQRFGLPNELSGAALKKISADSRLPINDSQMIRAHYFKTTSANPAFEPNTGTIVDTPVFSQTYYINAALPGQPQNMVQVMSLDYKQVVDNVKGLIDLVAEKLAGLKFIKVLLPLAFLIVGFIILACDLALYFKTTDSKGKQKSEFDSI